jgi:hypothetical protein
MGSRFRHSDGKTLPQESPASCRRRILPLAIWLFEGVPGRDDKRAKVSRGLEVARPFSGSAWQILVAGAAASRHRSVCGKGLRTTAITGILSLFISDDCAVHLPTLFLLIFFELASFAEVGFVCGRSQIMVASKDLAKPEVGTSGRLAFSAVFIVCSITRSRQVCKRNAPSASHRRVIGGLRPTEASTS